MPLIFLVGHLVHSLHIHPHSNPFPLLSCPLPHIHTVLSEMRLIHQDPAQVLFHNDVPRSSLSSTTLYEHYRSTREQCPTVPALRSNCQCSNPDQPFICCVTVDLFLHLSNGGNVGHSLTSLLRIYSKLIHEHLKQC